MIAYAGEDESIGNTPTLLVEMQTCTTTLENIMAVSQKIAN